MDDPARRGRGARDLRRVTGRRLLRAATRAALVLAELRAPYRGRSTPVNAWWGSFDLAVSLFSGLPADPPARDFIMRNAMDAQEVAVGWWPGDARYPSRVLCLRPSCARWILRPTSHREARGGRALGQYILDWDDVRASDDPHAYALDFARSAFVTPARSVNGIPRWRRAPTGPCRRSFERALSKDRATRPTRDSY